MPQIFDSEDVIIHIQMWTKIFQFLWIVGTIKQRSTSLQIDCAKRVQRCPVGKEQWAQKNEQLQCRTNYGYVCLRDSIGYLYESCMANFTVQGNSGNCPVLLCNEKKPHLGIEETYYHCPEEVPGCPPRNHPGYRIHHLYKYPKCVESSFSAEIESTSPRSSTSSSITTISTDHLSGQQNKHVVILIAIITLLFIVVGCFICYVVYFRKKGREYAAVTQGEIEDTFEDDEEKQITELRRLICRINESEADRVQIIPLKADDTLDVNRIYVPVSIVDEYEIQAGDKTNVSAHRLFHIQQENHENKLARFVFMLGEAGYGKTVQCQRISKSWCQAWKKENIQKENGLEVTDLERSLEEFDFVFFVQMRDVNNEQLSLIEMIQDAYSRYRISEDCINLIGSILKDEKCQCLVLLDGLDEWNISADKKKHLLDKGIPNCRDMSNCTILITMRFSKFTEVEHIRRPKFDKLVRLDGLIDDGIKELTTNMLCNYFHFVKGSDEFKDKYETIIEKVSSASFELKSLTKIPLLAVFCILSLCENVETGHSLTTFYLSITEALIKRSFEKEQTGTSKGGVPESTKTGILRNYPHVNNRLSELSRLGQIALEGLASEKTTLVFDEEESNNRLGKETVNFFLRIGLLTKRLTSGKFYENIVRISFLHKTIQEFISSLYLFSSKPETSLGKYISDEFSSTEQALQISTVLTFLSGLSEIVGCEISRYITKLSSKDDDIKKFRDHFSTETYNKVFHLYKLQLSCYREVREWKSIPNYLKDEQRKVNMKFSLSDIFLHGNDTDRLTIRESADVLRYHANDIKSLCMKFIPSDGDGGITNFELTEFLHKSESLVALNIDGYDRGKCRLFDDFNKEMPCLSTLGLFNVAFNGNTLADFLTKEESKGRINALGLFYIKSSDDLGVDYQYQFSSLHRLGSVRSGYVQKRIACSLSEMSKSQTKEKEHKPLLKCIFEVLPSYGNLSTFHVSYMDSKEDREVLWQVLPQIKKLTNFGYIGTAINPEPDYVYDTAVIKRLLEIKQLQIVFLNDIILKDDVLNFETLPKLERVTLEVFRMGPPEWLTFVSSISKIQNLGKVILNDTNIDDKYFKELQVQSSLLCFSLVKDESVTWHGSKADT